jgi:leader peptidase (prepilin peptidase) / N-methyltransferase
MSILYIFVFLYGLILGSFFNVVGMRVPLKQSIVSPRSACPGCGKQLKAAELIPVVSYLMQAGKCRGCGEKISILYPSVEFMTAVLFVAAPLFIGWNSELVIAWTLISLLMIIFVSDMRYMLIPDKVLLLFAGIFLLERIFIPLDPWWDSVIGSLVGFCLLLLIAVISKGGMGGGDIKLFAVLGFVLGLKWVLLTFFMATLYGAVFGLIGLLIGILKRGSAIPFGPFIAAGAITSYFFGDNILQFYLSFLGT